MGIESRHKKRVKPTSAPVKVIVGNERLSGEMPIEGGFHTIHLPVFTTPLVLGGKVSSKSDEDIEIVAIDTLHIGDSAEFMQSYRADGIEIKTKINIWPFIRMLAKIAYSYHVAEKGTFPRSESPVLPLSLNKTNYAKLWIGNIEEHPLTKAGSKALHLMDVTDIIGEDGTVCSVVRIKLFSTSSGPTYSVVTRIYAK
jgi:hypothetical protein